MGGLRNRSIRSCKIVRFAEDLHDYSEPDPNFVLTWEVIEDVWWQPEDFHSFKVSAKILADEAIEKGICRYLDRNYGHTDDKTQNALNLWAKCRVTRRGLERFINKEYAQRRLDTRQRTIQAVLYAQEQLHEEIHCGDVDRAIEVIRSVAVTVSAECQVFANMMAKADASAGALRVRKRQKPAVRDNISDITNPQFQNTSVTSQTSISSSRARPTPARRRVRRASSGSSVSESHSSRSRSMHAQDFDDTATVQSSLTNVTDISKPRAKTSTKSQRLPPRRTRSRRSSARSSAPTATTTSSSSQPLPTPSTSPAVASVPTTQQPAHKKVSKFSSPPSPTMSQPVSVCSDTSGNTGRNLPTVIQF